MFDDEYKQLYDGDAIELENKEVMRFACCDCGLVHKFAFAIEESGKIGFAIERDKLATENRRRQIQGGYEMEIIKFDKVPKRKKKYEDIIEKIKMLKPGEVLEIKVDSKADLERIPGYFRANNICKIQRRENKLFAYPPEPLED